MSSNDRSPDDDVSGILLELRGPSPDVSNAEFSAAIAAFYAHMMGDIHAPYEPSMRAALAAAAAVRPMPSEEQVANEIARLRAENAALSAQITEECAEHNRMIEVLQAEIVALRAEGKSAEQCLDGYATENQQFSDEIEALRTALNAVLSAWDSESDMGTLYQMAEVVPSVRAALAAAEKPAAGAISDPCADVGVGASEGASSPPPVPESDDPTPSIIEGAEQLRRTYPTGPSVMSAPIGRASDLDIAAARRQAAEAVRERIAQMCESWDTLWHPIELGIAIRAIPIEDATP